MRNFFRTSITDDARIIYQNINPSVLIHNSGYRLLNALFICNIHLYGNHLYAGLFNNICRSLFHLFLIAGHQRQVSPVLRQGSGQLNSKPPGSTCNNGNLACQIEIHSFVHNAPFCPYESHDKCYSFILSH